ncbi:MAG: tRNA pseudouridine(38-40) synthase TruA [Sphingobacteriales bacterium]|nr:MAG: tRNA pseudouridine(38-40) synthase TruA [Sphingobacteriales bacterium]
MPRYFLEVMYKGTAYSGFQVQENALSVQQVVEKALTVYLRQPVALTGSSRTDTGVHALQNFFHFDHSEAIPERFLYNINAMLPADVVIRSLRLVADQAHCRFDAKSREYAYHLYRDKDPFQADRAWYYPFPLDLDGLNRAAAILKEYEDFTSFSKRNTQVRTFFCRIEESYWEHHAGGHVYHVRANRFLRGMVRGLVGTMLQVGRGKISEESFRKIIEAKDCTKADFSTPARGLFLVRVNY